MKILVLIFFPIFATVSVSVFASNDPLKMSLEEVRDRNIAEQNNINYDDLDGNRHKELSKLLQEKHSKQVAKDLGLDHSNTENPPALEKEDSTSKIQEVVNSDPVLQGYVPVSSSNKQSVQKYSDTIIFILLSILLIFVLVIGILIGRVSKKR